MASFFTHWLFCLDVYLCINSDVELLATTGSFLCSIYLVSMSPFSFFSLTFIIELHLIREFNRRFF